MLDYRLIETAVAVVREGGFLRAAETLHLTQSAVSQRVKQLEDQLGQVLLSRTVPPTFTAAGRRLMRHFEQVKRLEQDLGELLAPAESEQFGVVRIAVNADSLATWFPAAIAPLLSRRRVLLDLLVEDQDEETLRLLRDGEVLGCVSAQRASPQGCRATRLSPMIYRLVATPAFVARWFPGGVDLSSVAHAPLAAYSRKDRLHDAMLRRLLGKPRLDMPCHYLPSSPALFDLIARGIAYGALAERQAQPLLARGTLCDLAPDLPLKVPLYWHCWNLRSDLLDELTGTLVAESGRLLAAR